MSTRKDRLLSGIRVQEETGLEIGALTRPVVSPDHPHIFYADHLSTEDLREKYRGDPNVDPDQLVPVTYIWGEKSLLESVGAQRFDYVLASHVIEHVPNVIGWLHDIAAILKPGGRLTLAIPDKRFTFDCRRELSTFAALVDAHMENRRRPSFAQVLDYLAEVADVPSATVGLQDLWNETLDPKSVARKHPEIINHFCEDWFRGHYEAIRQGLYMDVHANTFTPESFLGLLADLFPAGLLPYRIHAFTPTAQGDMEFFVCLQRFADDADLAEKSALFHASLAACLA